MNYQKGRRQCRSLVAYDSRSVGPRDNDVWNFARLVRLIGLQDREALSGDDGVKLASVWLIWTIRTAVEIARDVDWITAGGDNIENSRQFSEEGRPNGLRPRPIDKYDYLLHETGYSRSGRAPTYSKVDRGLGRVDRPGNGYGGAVADVAMIRAQRDVSGSTWPR